MRTRLLAQSRNGAVRTVTLNRPEKANALNDELLDGLLQAFSTPPEDEERVCVLRAAGKVFCAGMDLERRRETLGKPTTIEDMLRAVERYPLPVVAVVQGHAIAGGNELALHCDFVVAASEARFGMSLAQVGLAPTWFLTKKLMEICGPVAAREILLLGEPIPAPRMHAMGFIARVAPAAELEATVQAIVQRLAANAPLSLKVMKRVMLAQMAFRDDMDFAELNEAVRGVGGSEDAREGITARLEKRAPRFRNQ
jgi:enoyl-CoA hydratase/carnithine racemase